MLSASTELRMGAEFPWIVSVLNEAAWATAARERAAMLRMVIVYQRRAKEGKRRGSKPQSRSSLEKGRQPVRVMDVVDDDGDGGRMKEGRMVGDG